MTEPQGGLKDPAEIFEHAGQLHGDDRDAYLVDACGGDSSLRAEVESMLQAQAEQGEFLAEPTRTTEFRISETPGTVIDNYKLLQRIGEGGFGVVYMAEQVKPVQRKVALKIIKPGMDTREVIARFEAERQALALMDHPNIAKVLDGGATDSGRPYFVMELVKGLPLTEFCDKNHLSARERLELFATVCRAIQHAHHKGVIHRDIKPSNVMVTLHDGRAVPKVIDFGVSKAISQKLTEKTMFTAYGQMIGTPQYMSPEQAEMSGLDIDTRSDVYSLGVLLYELLTGSTPLEAERLRGQAYAELQRLIREEEPPRPSNRLSTLGNATASVAANRGTEPKKLCAQVHGELDWIVMRALDKDRSRRYETANSFADDVQRYLDDEPVVACPPSAVYRFRKLARRQAYISDMSLASTAYATGDVDRVRELLNRQILSIGSVQEDLRSVEWFHLKQALELHQKEIDAGNVLKLVVSPDASMVAASILVVGGPGKIRIYDSTDLHVLHTLDAVSDFPTPCFSPDGTLLAIDGHRGRIQLWKTADWSLAATAEPDYQRRQEGNLHAACIAFAPSGPLMASGDWQGRVTFWDTNTWRELESLQVHQDRVERLAFHPEGKLLAAGNTKNAMMRVWSMNSAASSHNLLHTIKGGRHGTTAVAFVRDSKTVWSGSMDWTIKTWDLSRCEPYDTIPRLAPPGKKSRFWEKCLTYTTDGKSLVFPDDEGVIRRWDLVHEKLLGEHQITDDRFFHLAMTDDGKVGWNRSTGKGIETVLFSFESGPHILPKKSKPWRSLAFSPNGGRLVVQDFLQCSIWDLNSGLPTGIQFNDDLPQHCAVFSPDGKTIVSGSADGSVGFWDTATGQLRSTFQHHDENAMFGGVGSVAISPSSETIATRGRDGTIKVWRTAPRDVSD